MLPQQVAGFVRVLPLLKGPYMRAWNLRQLGSAYVTYASGAQGKILLAGRCIHCDMCNVCSVSCHSEQCKLKAGQGSWSSRPCTDTSSLLDDSQLLFVWRNINDPSSFIVYLYS